MKPPVARFEVSCAAAALLVGMLLVMWGQHPSSACTLSSEAHRRLVLTRETDREHLARDVASVDRIARRYTASIPGDDQQHTRFLDCEARLIQQIATKHGVPPDQLRASAQ
jgi:hypothetical protein